MNPIILIPVNEKIACTPPESTQMKVKVAGGFGRVEQKTQLTGLKVVFGNERAPAMPNVLAPTGCTVYVSGEALAAHAWAKQVYEHEGVKFIMVPVSMIVLIAPEGVAPVTVSGGGEPESTEKPAVMVREVP